MLLQVSHYILMQLLQQPTSIQIMRSRCICTLIGWRLLLLLWRWDEVLRRGQYKDAVALIVFKLPSLVPVQMLAHKGSCN
jgi:hypothetical protein